MLQIFLYASMYISQLYSNYMYVCMNVQLLPLFVNFLSKYYRDENVNLCNVSCEILKVS